MSATDGAAPTPRRPRPLTPSMMDTFARESLDPAVVTQVAHETAAALVGAGRSTTDPQVIARLIAIVDDIGLDTVADLWAQRPARSLPGALWRLYAVREWVRRDPVGVSADYTHGLAFAEVAGVIAGAASPPGPAEMRVLADVILTGVFTGDLAVALERAAAFCRVIAAGRGARETPDLQPHRGSSEVRLPQELRAGAAMLATAADLQACARLWHAGDLD